MSLNLTELLDRLAGLAAQHSFGPLPEDWGEGDDSMARAVLRALRDPDLRPEHRQRIHEDFVAQRDLLLREPIPHLVDLVVWSEHVEALYGAHRKGKLATWHYTRALEATCRRCSFELLPLMGKLDAFSRAWAGRDFVATCELVCAQWAAE